MSKLRVRYFGPFAQHTGYSQAAHDYMMAIHRAGIDLDICPALDCDTDRLDPRYHELIPLVRKNEDPNWPTHVISHTVPNWCHMFVTDELAPPPHVRRIALTTWETDKLNAEAVHNLNTHFDEVWVPCRYNETAFKKSGLTNQIVRIPHTFDINNFWNIPATAFPEKNVSPFVFYAILTWCERKNPIGLLKAYLTEFTCHDDVILKILTPSYNAIDLEALYLALGLTDLPPVQFLGGMNEKRITQEELRQLHLTSHCYVSTARSEGWGLGIFEAALFGNCVIAPNYSGYLDFLEHYYQKDLVNYTLTPAITPDTKSQNVIFVNGLAIRPILRNDHVGVVADQHWAEPDLFETKQYMRIHYEAWKRNPTEYHVKEARHALKRYDYSAIGLEIKEVLERTL